MNLFGFNQPQAPETGSLQSIDAHTLKQWLEQDAVTLVDVREPGEYASGYIPGATLVSLSRFDADKIPQTPNRKIVLYCRSGQRSTMAAYRLFSQGYQEVAHLDNGIGSWVRAGYPIQA
ncbi:rhodanese-like domain-containing protein [Pantanalinema rosaneae CENA516]|uniref:rhodanese-like domain-containing protein n=1 Tax=Pantanalinema rosaneae TaxID=1620701 RepID=UPI003D6E710A